ncbi:MAG: hypothetical protein WCO84_08310 [bacterium]
MLNTHFTNGMLKYASVYSNIATKGYNLASGAVKNVGKALLTKEDPITKARRFSAKKTALTAGGLYAGSKVLGEMKNQQKSLGRDYMDDIHPYRQSDTLRVAR